MSTVSKNTKCDHDNLVGQPAGEHLTAGSCVAAFVAMVGSVDEFRGIVAGLLTRYCAQLSQPVESDHIGRLAGQLSALVVDRGLPQPLAPDELGAPGGMAEEECAPLIARVIEGLHNPVLADAARQLVKACFYPELKVCRDSFREVARDGACRRQQLDRARKRISGSHCVDCPHWVALEKSEHLKFLRSEWRGVPDELAAQPDIFLPDDFRQLRLWLHAAARSTPRSGREHL